MSMITRCLEASNSLLEKILKKKNIYPIALSNKCIKVDGGDSFAVEHVGFTDSTGTLVKSVFVDENFQEITGSVEIVDKKECCEDCQ